MKKQEKTVRELYNEFLEKFTIDQVSQTTDLSMIFTYLKSRCGYQNGNYVHVPGVFLRALIEKHLDHTYIATPNPTPSCQNA